MKKLDLIRWKRAERQLREARVKRDTLMEDTDIDRQDELIWKLEGKYAKYVLKYYPKGIPDTPKPKRSKK